MDSLTHFHSRNVYFCILHSYSLKVMAVSIFQNFWVDTNHNAVNMHLKPQQGILFLILYDIKNQPLKL